MLPPQIEIRNPTFTQKNQLYGFSTLTQKQPYDEDYTFTASGKNKSKSKVRAFRLNVTALDCPTQDGRSAGCEVAGHGDGTFTVDIPPGEVRQINGEFNLLDVPNPNGAGFSPRFAVRAVLAPLDEAEDTSDDDILARWNYKCENVK